MKHYRSFRIIGWVIVDENGNITNRNPSKKEFEGLDKEPYKYGRSKPRCDYIIGTTCHKCIEDDRVTDRSVLCPGNVNREIDKDGNENGK